MPERCYIRRAPLGAAIANLAAPERTLATSPPYFPNFPTTHTTTDNSTLTKIEVASGK
jgi:hypothetical protein